MIFTVANADTAILQNLVETLAQIKVSGQGNVSVPIDTVNVGTTPDEGFETLTDAQLEAKFKSLAEGVLTADRSSRLIDFCWNMEYAADAGQLARLAAA